ncbi:hypothetical protein NP493_386g01029 [Ridgeia piscesae]|uniref:Josephin-2 n=1 Tax=Ridgeia piscesae TaxID=27915 RepID=A0AAD9NSY6_RIDPI|nr:hypothetical protein NP493_386g01029 [Ridgeia piscesae]
MCLTMRKKDNQVYTQEGGIYHEKQSRELCALHALNNLFQDRHAFTKRDLDNICLTLSPEAYINPHRSLLGLGNYDVNVIMAALQSKHCDIIWFDKRKNIDRLQLDNILGFILNVPTDFSWGVVHLPVYRKHWIAIREINDTYYNLDSKLNAPQKIKDVLVFLKEQIESKEKELLLVVSSEISEAGTWYQDNVVTQERVE